MSQVGVEQKKTAGRVVLPDFNRPEYTMELLYTDYVKPIYRHFYKITKDEGEALGLAHDVFVKAYTSMSKIDSRKAGGFLSVVCGRVKADYFKVKYNRPQQEYVGDLDISEFIHDGGFSDPARLYEIEKAMERISAASRLVSPKLRNPFLMREIYGYTTNEVCEEYGIRDGRSINDKSWRTRQVFKKHCGGTDSLLALFRGGAVGCLSESALSFDGESDGILGD